ncbi:DUF1801 domain-containing protein [Flagellimonas pacifica]|uniref:YdhG-like domain-containing protein n=1 Tax=Flagellimonas pacifica TaxID=1247520 RepID=A0A285MC27_9FLAO|nr:DUF1801 domain-containing protein [Allomuricauda parva]SNY94724.1 protein of unknown function (DU1801) [Allomuricauda parva]
MKKLQLQSKPEVASVFANYPDMVREQMERLRQLVLEVAQEDPEISELGETLKWGEPSYVTKKGSTLRMDWKAKAPNQYALYFQCTSKLVPTFKLIYGKQFTYEGNRAIIFQLDDELPEAELKNCIRATLNYHKVKHLPNLGL